MGALCMQAGASCPKVCNCNRDKESANLFCKPGTCLDLKKASIVIKTNQDQLTHKKYCHDKSVC